MLFRSFFRTFAGRMRTKKSAGNKAQNRVLLGLRKPSSGTNSIHPDVILDAGYESKDDVVKECGMNPIICEKGHRNNPLTDEQKQSNRTKSKTRCRVERIFGFVEGAMNGSLVRSIGMIRAKAANALTNLVYNIFRYVQINIYQPQLITCKE